MADKRTSKSILFLGIILLVVGILVRKLSAYPSLGLLILLTGVGLKTYYIIAKVKTGEYKPGKELWFLFVGLCLFLSGLYLRGKDLFIDPSFLIVLGIGLKVVFIIRFIQKVRRSSTA